MAGAETGLGAALRADPDRGPGAARHGRGAGGRRAAGAGRAPPLTAKLGSGQGAELLAEALPVLSAAVPQLAEAEARLARAQAARASIGGDLHPRLAEQLPRLDRLLPLACTGLQAAQVAPACWGPTPRAPT